MIEYLYEVNEATDIPITTAETYNIYLSHPDIAEKMDFILIHVHPYWDDISITDAPQYAVNKWNFVRQTYQKEVIIGETNWPSGGDILGEAIPSEENQKKFLEEFKSLAVENNIKYFFFEAFDEPWKSQSEGEVGHIWGLFYADRTEESALHSIYNFEQVSNNKSCCFIETFY